MLWDRSARVELPGAKRQQRLKVALIWLIIALTVLLPTAKMVLLRHENLPQSYSHDGGVIQTEAAIDFFLAGRNPYVEDYRSTPMAEWGLPEFRTALDHYPYLPWTYVFSAPVKAVERCAAGLVRPAFRLSTRLRGCAAPGHTPGPIHPPARASRSADAARPEPPHGPGPDLRPKRPLRLGLDRPRPLAAGTIRLHPPPLSTPPLLTPHLLSSAAFGLACASKPTAWFLAPFFALLLVRDQLHSWRDIPRALPAMLKRGWPALAVFALLVGPYLIWNANALVDDVWRWAAGTTPNHYQIWGWGASNFVLAFGGLASRFDTWPFWIPELIVTVPLLIWLGWRQTRHNGLGAACWHYGLLLLGFLYVSRFLNENYLGYILAFLAMGYFIWDGQDGLRPQSGGD